MQDIPQNQLLVKPRQKLPLKKILVIAIAVAIWSCIFWRAIHVFAPNTLLGAFSSDQAIPVLMSNDERPITLFNLYYYGAGRWGGWPFLFAQVFRRLTGFYWTDYRLFVAQAAWVFFGAFAVAGLVPKERFIAALIYLFSICLHGLLIWRMFDLGQVYAWQLGALILAWYGLRRFFDHQSRLKPIVHQMVWGFFLLWFSFLSIWSSSASLFFLVLLLAVETWNARTKMKLSIRRLWLQRAIFASLIVLVATGCERLMRADYHRHNLKHYRFEYRWVVVVDSGYLSQNLHRQIANLLVNPWWKIYFVAPIFLIVLACVCLYLRRKNMKGVLATINEAVDGDTLAVIAGSISIAVINFILVVLANHVRLNDYDNRFLTPTYLFAMLGGLLSIFLVLKWLVLRFTSWHKVTEPAIVLVLLVILAINFPPQTHSPLYEQTRTIALTLEQREPRGVLMGGYWQTYVFSALQRDNSMTPVPLEGQDLRTPWTPAALRNANHVVLEYGAGRFPVPQTLNQYGQTLNLVEPEWYRNGEYAFALYVNEKK